MPASSLPSIAASQLHIAPLTNQLRVLQVELESVASDLCQLTLSGICLAGLGSGAHGLCAYHHFSSDSATSLAVTLSGWEASSLCSHFSLFCRWKWGSRVPSALSTPASSQATRGCPSRPAPWTRFVIFFFKLSCSLLFFFLASVELITLMFFHFCLLPMGFQAWINGSLFVCILLLSLCIYILTTSHSNMTKVVCLSSIYRLKMFLLIYSPSYYKQELYKKVVVPPKHKQLLAYLSQEFNNCCSKSYIKGLHLHPCIWMKPLLWWLTHFSNFTFLRKLPNCGL